MEQAVTRTLSPSEGHRFTGHWREYRGTVPGGSVLDGLDFMHAREYDWRLGRFTAPDPAASSWNAYAYVLGNPVNFTDPQGLRPIVGEGWSDLARNVAMAGSTETAWEVLFSGMISATADDTVSHNLVLVEKYLATLRGKDASEEPFAVRQARALELVRVLEAYRKRLAVLSHMYRTCEQWQQWTLSLLAALDLQHHVRGAVNSVGFPSWLGRALEWIAGRLGKSWPATSQPRHVATFLASSDGAYLLILDPWALNGLPGVFTAETWPFEIAEVIPTTRNPS